MTSVAVKVTGVTPTGLPDKATGDCVTLAIPQLSLTVAVFAAVICATKKASSQPASNLGSMMKSRRSPQATVTWTFWFTSDPGIFRYSQTWVVFLNTRTWAPSPQPVLVS